MRPTRATSSGRSARWCASCPTSRAAAPEVYALYVTHPQVRMDPAVPVPRWGLSEQGRARAEAFAHHPLVRRVRQVIASDETKAVELAQILAAVAAAPVSSEATFGENDRSSTDSSGCAK